MKSIPELFNSWLPEKIAENPLCLAGAGIRERSILVSIDGATGGQWAFRFDATGAVSMVSEKPANPDCSIETKEQTFQGILNGSTNVAFAFMMGKIKVRGDSGLATKIGLELKKLVKG